MVPLPLAGYQLVLVGRARYLGKVHISFTTSITGNIQRMLDNYKHINIETSEEASFMHTWDQLINAMFENWDDSLHSANTNKCLWESAIVIEEAQHQYTFAHAIVIEEAQHQYTFAHVEAIDLVPPPLGNHTCNKYLLLPRCMYKSVCSSLLNPVSTVQHIMSHHDLVQYFSA